MSRAPFSPLWTSTCGRHDIGPRLHIALLKGLVQWPSGPKAEIRLYECNLFKPVLLVIYITNLYRRKFSTFYSVERRNSGKKDTNFFAWEDRMTSVDLFFNFLCGHPHGAWPLPRPHASTWAWPPPLHVDVINGWPLFANVRIESKRCLSHKTSIIIRIRPYSYIYESASVNWYRLSLFGWFGV